MKLVSTVNHLALQNQSSMKSENLTPKVEISDVASSMKSIKNVSFDSIPVIHVLNDKGESRGNSEFKLSLIEREYRKDVDKEARNNGLTFAAGHDFEGPKTIYPYDHNLALEAFRQL
ncbi:Uncharacterised protein [Yersinia nurmii]|uniref:Uncharacterized protein n=1 Tax=Yersinia nurmii TaxID=685706 RepID=A0ABM9S0K7_9GAMM|nr:hypothetical protein [Yersinia nurmii]CND85056.1 Uncharacterised protein [Yersinia nurmii]